MYATLSLSSRCVVMDVKGRSKHYSITITGETKDLTVLLIENNFKLLNLNWNYVFVDETSIDDVYHFHGFFDTISLTTFGDIRYVVQAICEPGEKENFKLNYDIQRTQNIKRWLSYITKSSPTVRYRGISTSGFHFFWQLRTWCTKQRYFSYLDPFVVANCHRHQYILLAYTEYKRTTLVPLLRSGPYTEYQFHIANAIRESQDNLYIWGQTGAGKTTVIERELTMRSHTVLYLSTLHPTIYDFGNLDDSYEYIYHPEVRSTWIDYHRETILRLCDLLPATIQKKYAHPITTCFSGRFIFASNFPPPDDDAFLRRFKVIKMLNKPIITSDARHNGLE